MRETILRTKGNPLEKKSILSHLLLGEAEGFQDHRRAKPGWAGLPSRPLWIRSVAWKRAGLLQNLSFMEESIFRKHVFSFSHSVEIRQ